MQDEYYAIGEAAGKVYKILEKNGEQTVSKLQKDAGVADDALFNQAIGWLAREEKVHLNKTSRTFKISLLTSCTHK